VDRLDGKMNDGGERIAFGENTAMREPATGKGRPGLISPFALTRVAKWYELGANKYADRNWEKGMPFSRYTDSMFRHLIAWEKGDETEDHLSAIIWNAMAIIHHQERKELKWDDMPHYLKKTCVEDCVGCKEGEEE
jgi:hypothetical protein